MEDLYSIHPSIPRSPVCNNEGEGNKGTTSMSTLSESLKEQISAHPLYSSLLSAYIECRKVGAPPELASQLEEIQEIGKENYPNAPCADISADPELDHFMESYCDVLMRYKEELSRSFDEAASFLSMIQLQLRDLCKSSTSTSTITSAVTTVDCRPPEASGSSEEFVCCEGETSEEPGNHLSRLGDQDVKDMLLRKYSGYLSSLRKELLKKKKKPKLPGDSRVALLDWWNTHYRWPYPTDEEKVKLAGRTGLDQKQINNWFINQRKRHWKPSDEMQVAFTEGLSGGGNETEIYSP